MLTYYPSPIGNLRIETEGDAVTGISLCQNPQEPAESSPDALMLRCREELRRYFAGELRQFTFPIAPRGTDFQLRIWVELCKVPYGETISYAALAQRACGNRRYARAAAGAAHKNPILLAIPCHRMIGADGSLTGFAAGIKCKEYLLDLERNSFLK